MNVLEILGEAVMITGFVVSMMLVVEYLNVATSGRARAWVERSEAASRTTVVALGATPGCLGSFTNVALYVHGLVPLGALAGGMIATSGDEAFVMLALFPKKAVLLFTLLFAYGLAVAWLVDRLGKRRCFRGRTCVPGFALHLEEEAPHPLQPNLDAGSWSTGRGALTVGLVGFAVAVAVGFIGPPHWGWVRLSLLVVTALAAWIVVTVPEHFVEQHLVRHVVREHAPRVLLWTLGTLLVVQAMLGWQHALEPTIRAAPAAALVVAALLGVVPQSGPHLIFVTLFAQGIVPFSVLATSSIVQDGHGMLPLLAESRGEFARVKLINLTAGLFLGGILLACGT